MVIKYEHSVFVLFDFQPPYIVLNICVQVYNIISMFSVTTMVLDARITNRVGGGLNYFYHFLKIPSFNIISLFLIIILIQVNMIY